MPNTPSKPVSLRTYAKRRGVSLAAVQRAIDSGRLTDSVVTVDGERKIGDQDLADREWGERTRPRGDSTPSRGGPLEDLVDEVTARAFADDTIDYAEARRRREVELWRQARIKREADELELAKLKEEVISTDEARAAVVDAYSVVKTKLLGLPARVKQRLPGVSADDVRVIDDLVRQALEELADGGTAGGQ